MKELSQRDTHRVFGGSGKSGGNGGSATKSGSKSSGSSGAGSGSAQSGGGGSGDMQVYPAVEYDFSPSVVY